MTIGFIRAKKTKDQLVAAVAAIGEEVDRIMSKDVRAAVRKGGRQALATVKHRTPPNIDPSIYKASRIARQKQSSAVQVVTMDLRATGPGGRLVPAAQWVYGGTKERFQRGTGRFLGSIKKSTTFRSVKKEMYEKKLARNVDKALKALEQPPKNTLS